MVKRTIIDIIMFILMILEFSRVYMPPVLHEIIGIILIMTVIVHLVYNHKYIKSISLGRYDLKRRILLLINVLLIITFIITALMGLLSSQFIPFLNIGYMSTVYLHKIFAYALLIIVAIHIGFNFNDGINRKVNNNHIAYVVEIIIVALGIYCLIHVDYLNHLTGNVGFSMMEGNIFVNILEYLFIILSISLIVNFAVKVKRG